MEERECTLFVKVGDGEVKELDAGETRVCRLGVVHDELSFQSMSRLRLGRLLWRGELPRHPLPRLFSLALFISVHLASPTLSLHSRPSCSHNPTIRREPTPSQNPGLKGGMNISLISWVW